MRKKERPGDRVRQFRQALDLTQEGLAGMLAFSTSQVSLIEAHHRKPSIRFLEFLATVVNASSEWIMTGEGAPLVPCFMDDKDGFLRRLENIRRIESAQEGVAETTRIYDVGYRIPVISHAAANPQNRLEFEDIENEWTKFPVGIVAIRIIDESMSPVVWPGQFVLCDPEADVGDGDLVVAKIKYRGLLFKRVYFEKKRDLVMLHSVNQARNEPPLIVDQADVEYRFKVIGAKFE